MKTKYVRIDGIHCKHCIEIITNELMKNKKIKEVKIKRNIAYISYDKKLSIEEIIDSINELDYFTKEEYISDNLKDVDTRIKAKEFLIIFAFIIFIYFLIKIIFGFSIFLMIPNIDEKTTYPMLVVIGLLTSIHCISMCGAINLLAVYDTKRNIKNSFLYNFGRVLSYTIIGAIVGLLGSLLKVNETINGIIVIISAIVMLIMSLSMLGIIPLISLKYNYSNKSKSSFIIGLLNGLMPCGPLQAMEIYALSTGNVFTGALSMFLFGIGTVPLMFSLGFIYNLFKGKTKLLVNKISAILILLLSLVMFNRGLLSFNIDLFNKSSNYDEFISSVLHEDYQVVEIDLSIDHFEDIIVQKGVPVKLIINVEEKNLTTCNNWVMMRNFDVLQRLYVGKNEITFTPNEVGDYFYTCRMNMLKNRIKVIDDKDYFKEKNNE